jgi:hypothetical protein
VSIKTAAAEAHIAEGQFLLEEQDDDDDDDDDDVYNNNSLHLTSLHFTYLLFMCRVSSYKANYRQRTLAT